jgi:hypothetical protein
VRRHSQTRLRNKSKNSESRLQKCPPQTSAKYFLGYIQPSVALRNLSTVNLHDRTKSISTEGNVMARKLDGKKVAILVADGFEQAE